MSKRKSFKELQEQFKKQQEERKNRENRFVNSDIYPFWQMEDGEECIVRILPDKNEENPNPFPISIPYLEHTLTIDGRDRRIPSLVNWGETDPIAELSQKYYREEGRDSVNGKKYWRKKIDLLRAVIIKDPLNPEGSEENVEGQVKTLRFGFQLMAVLNEAIASPDMDVEPWDLENGYNFVIKKTAQGKGNSTYAIGSGFVRRPSDITDMISDDDIIDLRTLLPANPGLTKVQRMLDAHLTGSALDDNEDGDGDGEKEVRRSTSGTDDSYDPDNDDNELREVESKPAPSKVEESDDEGEEEDDDDILLQQILNRNRK